MEYMVKLKEIVQKMTSRRLNIVCLWKTKLIDEKSREIELDWDIHERILLWASQLTHPPNLGRAKITLIKVVKMYKGTI